MWNMLCLKQILSAKVQSLAVVKQTERKIVTKSSSCPVEIPVIKSQVSLF